MNNLPKVSIVLSAYNNENTIKDAVNSLLAQTYENIEILLLDDKSTDGSEKTIKEYAKNYSNIKDYYNDSNIGLTKSLNRLIKISDAEIIARQDADDISTPNRIELQVNELLKHNLDFVSSRAFILNSNKKIPGKSFYIPYKILLKYKNPFIHGTLLIRKEVLKRVGFYDEDYYYSQDYKLMIDLIDQGYKYKVLKDPLYGLNTVGNISNINAADQMKYANLAKAVYNKKRI